MQTGKQALPVRTTGQIKRAMKRRSISLRQASRAIKRSPAIICQALSGKRKAGITLELLRQWLSSEANNHANSNASSAVACQGQTLPQPPATSPGNHRIHNGKARRGAVNPTDRGAEARHADRA